MSDDRYLMVCRYPTFCKLGDDDITAAYDFMVTIVVYP